MAGSEVYFSDMVEGTAEGWTKETAAFKIKTKDSFSSRARVLTFTVADSGNNKEDVYYPYRRIKLVEKNTGNKIYLGRVELSDPYFDNTYGQVLDITVIDYSRELYERKIDSNYTATASPYITAVPYKRSQLIKQLVYDYTYPGTVFATGIEDSGSSDTISKDYSKYDKAVIQEINTLASEDYWTDETWATNTPSGAVWRFGSTTGAGYINNTINADTATGSFTWLSATDQYHYLGLNNPFLGAIFTLNALGNYGPRTWQYWAGTGWANLTLIEAFDFLATTGTVRWELPTNWEATGFSSTFPHNGYSPPDTTARYWVRCSVSSVTTAATVYKIEAIRGCGYDFYVDDDQVFNYFRRGSRKKNFTAQFKLTSETAYARAMMHNYSFSEQAKELITRVTCRGHDASATPVSYTAINSDLESKLKITKEKIEYVWGKEMTTSQLTTYVTNRAKALLTQYGGTSGTGAAIFRGSLNVLRYPYCSGASWDTIRVGDMIRVTNSQRDIDEDMLVTEIIYQEPEMESKISVLSASWGKGYSPFDLTSVLDSLRLGQDVTISQARINDLVVNEAFINSLNAEKLVFNSASGGELVVGGINTWGTTLIQPGRIVISGAVTLGDWRAVGDPTMINGSGIYNALDGIPNGGTYAKVRQTEITDGYIKLTDQTVFSGSATFANGIISNINTYSSTLIEPGKIQISGATTLTAWRHPSDPTQMDGGDIYQGLDSITGGVTYARVRATELGAGYIKLTDNLTISGTSTLGNVLSSGVNLGTTLIEPGRIRISGGTTLASWRDSEDETLINGGMIAANSILVGAMGLGSPNWLDDPSFERSAEASAWVGWEEIVGSNWGWSTGTNSYGGDSTKAYAYCVDSSTDQKLRSAAVRVNYEDVFTAQCMYKLSATAGVISNFYIRIVFLKEDLVTTAGAYNSDAATKTTTYTMLSVSAKAPAGTSYACVELFVDGLGSAGSNYWRVDDINFSKGSIPIYFGTPGASPTAVEINSSGVIGWLGGTKQFWLDATDGKGYFGAGKCILDVTGLSFRPQTGVSYTPAIRFYHLSTGTDLKAHIIYRVGTGLALGTWTGMLDEDVVFEVSTGSAVIPVYNSIAGAATGSASPSGTTLGDSTHHWGTIWARELRAGTGSNQKITAGNHIWLCPASKYILPETHDDTLLGNTDRRFFAIVTKIVSAKNYSHLYLETTPDYSVLPATNGNIYFGGTSARWAKGYFKNGLDQLDFTEYWADISATASSVWHDKVLSGLGAGTRIVYVLMYNANPSSAITVGCRYNGSATSRTVTILPYCYATMPVYVGTDKTIEVYSSNHSWTYHQLVGSVRLAEET